MIKNKNLINNLRFKKRDKILCIGEVLVDFVGIINNIEDDKEIKFVKKIGGAPANVAKAIKQFNSNPILIGSIGKDKNATFLSKKLQDSNISLEYIKKIDNIDTTTTKVYVGKNKERHFKFFRGADEYVNFKEIPKNILKECKIFHFGSATAFLGGELEKTYDKLLDYAIKNRKIISFDPNYRDSLFKENKANFIEKAMKFISYANILKVNEHEIRLISKEESLQKAIEKLLNFGAKNIFVTMGYEGTIYATNNYQEKISSIKVNVIDTTGAGDSFIGTLLAQISRDKTSIKKPVPKRIKKYVKISNIAAALTVTKKGAFESIPSKDEVIKYI